MLNWVQTLITVLTYLWPLRMVEQWERGNYYIAGHFMKEVGPGVWPILPYFMDVKTASVVPGIISTPLLNITASDGSTPISFSAAATIQIVSVDKAYNKIETVRETTREMLAAVTADKLADVDVSRLDGGSRRRLVADLKKWMNKELEFAGIEVLAIRFTNFMVGVRSYRFMTDTSLLE